MPTFLTYSIRLLACVFIAAPTSIGLADEGGPQLPSMPPAPAANAAPAPAAAIESPAAASQSPSEAERISRLDRTLESDVKRLAELKEDLNSPGTEYAEAQSEFEQCDSALTEKKKQLQELTKRGPTKASNALRGEIAELQKKWSEARDHFDLLIRERKAVQESIVALEQKIEHDREALEELRGTAKQNSEKHEAAESKTKERHAPHPASNAAKKDEHDESSDDKHGKAESESETSTEESEEDAEALAEASAAAEAAKEAAEEAESEAKSISERIVILEKNIALARELRDTAHKKIDSGDRELKELSEQLSQKLNEGANTDELNREFQETTERVREAREQSREASTNLDELQSTLTALQAEQLAAAHEAEQKRHAAQEAANVVRSLNNPFSAHNLTQTFLDHGPRILVIVLATLACLWLSRVLESRLVGLVASRGSAGNRKDRENRAKTLLGIFHNAANILIFGGGIVCALQELGIPVGPLIGGAAVIGLAVAFGAQSLIKDYFTGFLVLLEHQYLVNDVIKIDSITGQVERITLRTTVLRDGEGNVHFVPHGQLTTVTNTTHGWSKAVFDIRVAYRESVDFVIDVLSQLARELNADDRYGSYILDEPAMSGVEAFTDSGVVISFSIKTRPQHKSEIRHELLRRIKNKFDELGIEMPQHSQFERRDSGSTGTVAKRRAG